MEEPTLIANQGRSSGRFAHGSSKRSFYSLFFPKSGNYTLPTNAQVDADNSIIYPDEAFHHGITFEAKLIGIMDIPRPQSRMEIVAAMRKVRFDHKTRGIGKRKVDIRVSVDGVKVSTHNSGNHRLGFGRVEYDKLDNLIQIDQESCSTILQHPIHRIFYVSHDSQDLNVFSYMARETKNDYLRCIVFKAKKKTDAMQIVKTVGQAFDVCHQLATKSPKPTSSSSLRIATPQKKSHLHASPNSSPLRASKSTSETIPLLSDNDTTKGVRKSLSENYRTTFAQSRAVRPSQTTVTFAEEFDLHAPPPSEEAAVANKNNADGQVDSGQTAKTSSTTIARVRLDYELQKSRVSKSQINFLKNQLASETAARVDAQNRIDELLRQNAMLLDVIENLLAPSETSPGEKISASIDDLLASAQLRVSGGRHAPKLLDSKLSSIQSSSGEVCQISGSTSSPDSGFKSTSSFNLRDEETY